MTTLRFKTNIKCGGCVAKVTPHLEADQAIESWQVDTTNPNKLLTVEGENLDAEHVTEIVKKAGFRAEVV
ncbi:MAG: heavy-metal-associated domain-containing protein [Ferruginibacter sp.]|nr:heavy-metal-associated domain-containing protein [Cytophagales bacterium]